MTRSRAALCLLLALGGPGCGAEAAPGACPSVPPVDGRPSDPNYGEALDAACRWGARYPDHWTLAVTQSSRAAGFHRDGATAPCTGGTTEPVVSLFDVGGTEFELHLRCSAAQARTVEELRAALRHVVLRNLPHGASAPDWRFRVLTEELAISDGVELVSLEGGELTLRLRTPIAALYGYSVYPPCVPPADGMTAPRCFLRFEHPIPLDLTLRAPFDPADLD